MRRTAAERLYAIPPVVPSLYPYPSPVNSPSPIESLRGGHDDGVYLKQREHLGRGGYEESCGNNCKTEVVVTVSSKHLPHAKHRDGFGIGPKDDDDPRFSSVRSLDGYIQEHSLPRCYGPRERNSKKTVRFAETAIASLESSPARPPLPSSTTWKTRSKGVQVTPPLYHLRFLPECKTRAGNLCLVGRILSSQCGLACLILAWTLLGAGAFHFLEGPQEQSLGSELRRLQRTLVVNLATELRQVVPHEPVWCGKIEEYFARHETMLLEQVSHGYVGEGTIWSYAGSLLFAVSLITTLGFGAPVPRTSMGRMAAVLFAAVGIPLHLLLVVNFGTLVADLLQHVSRKSPSLAALALRGNRQQMKKNGPEPETIELESPSLPTIIRRNRTPTENSKNSPKMRTRQDTPSPASYRSEASEDGPQNSSSRNQLRTSMDDGNDIQTGNPESSRQTSAEVNSVTSTPQVWRRQSVGTDSVNMEWPSSSSTKTVLVLPAREERNDGAVYRNRTRIQLPPIQRSPQTQPGPVASKHAPRPPSQAKRRTHHSKSTYKENSSDYGELPAWLKWSPLVAIAIYYLLGVLLFGWARGKGPSSCFLFPLDFTTAGGVGNEPGVIRTIYALYLECAVVLAISAVSIWRVSATRGMVDLGLKLNIVTAGYTS